MLLAATSCSGITCLLASLPVGHSASLSASLPRCWPVSLLACLLPCLPACLSVSLPAWQERLSKQGVVPKVKARGIEHGRFLNANEYH